LTTGGVQSSRHFELHELTNGVYATIAIDGGWAVCNAGIVDLGDETIVFDTFVNQDAALDLKEAAEQLTGKPVSAVINSHWHSDHVKGNQTFIGAKIISTKKTVEVMASVKKRYEMETEIIRKDLEKDLESVRAGPDDSDKILNEGYDLGHLEGLPTLKYTLPGFTFEDNMTFDGRKRRAEAITYGGGHTVSDVLLHLPEERIIFPGDLIFIENQPYLVDGDPEELLRILDKIEALDAKTLVPGHGPAGTPKDISPVKDYVLALQKLVEDVRTSGGGLNRAAERPIPTPFDTWKWRSFYKDNLEFLFQRNSKPG